MAKLAKSKNHGVMKWRGGNGAENMGESAKKRLSVSVIAEWRKRKHHEKQRRQRRKRQRQRGENGGEIMWRGEKRRSGNIRKAKEKAASKTENVAYQPSKSENIGGSAKEENENRRNQRKENRNAQYQRRRKSSAIGGVAWRGEIMAIEESRRKWQHEKSAA
jgi:hypothetical protein